METDNLSNVADIVLQTAEYEPTMVYSESYGGEH